MTGSTNGIGSRSIPGFNVGASKLTAFAAWVLTSVQVT